MMTVPVRAEVLSHKGHFLVDLAVVYVNGLAAARTAHASLLAQVAHMVREAGPQVSDEALRRAADNLVNVAHAHFAPHGNGAGLVAEERQVRSTRKRVKFRARENLLQCQDTWKMFAKGRERRGLLGNIACEIDG